MIAVLALTGCDTFDTFVKKDKSPVSLTDVAKSSTEAPAKVAAIRARELEIQKLLGVAETAFNAGDLDGAEQSYQSLDKLEPGNLRAAEGLHRIEARRHHQVVLDEAKNLLGKSEADDDRSNNGTPHRLCTSS